MNVYKYESKRLQWADLLRVIAIGCVVLCHAVERTYRFNLQYMSSVSFLSQIFAFTVFSIGRLGVPIFMLLSGYLLLDRDYDEKAVVNFWKKNWLHLVLCTWIWIMLNWGFTCIFLNYPFSAQKFIEELFFLRGSNLSHMWYMPMLLGMYLLFPYVANGLRSLKLQTLFFPLLILFLYAFGRPLANWFVNTLGGVNSFSEIFSLGFSGGYYGLIFICGYILKHGALKKIRGCFLATSFIFSFILLVILQIWSYHNGFGYYLWYDNILLIISALCLFELGSRIRRFRSKIITSIISMISKYSFGIYLTHNLVKEAVLPLFGTLNYSRPSKTILLWLLLFGGGFLASVLINHIPKVGRFVLYIKEHN